MGIKQVILGTLLGDASIYQDRTTYRLDMSHGWKQREYLKWKAKLIDCRNSIQQYETGYGSVGYRIRFYDKSILSPIADMVLRNGIKTITNSWLSELDNLSLAIWYQDDGSWGRDGPRMKNGDRGSRNITFSTEGFDGASVRRLTDWMCSLGYSARVRKSKGKYEVISLNHSSTIKFWETVAPFIFIRSKIDTGKKPGITYCKCGICIEPKMIVCTPCLKKSASSHNRQRLIRRFGTSKLCEIEQMQPIPDCISEYWIDQSRIGSAL